MNFHEYCGVKIPVMESRNARPFYNLPDSEIDKMRAGTRFDAWGDCMEPGGFRGTPFGDRFAYLDDAEVKERSAFAEANKACVFSVFRDAKVPVKNQGPHGYCWAYGACSALEASLLIRTGVYHQLSADSIAAEVKRGRDEGGWANEFLEHAQEFGVVPQSLWKLHDRDYRKYQTPEVKAAREAFKPDEWLDIPRVDMAALRSLLASNMACGMGLMWWGHLVVFTNAVWSDKLGWLYLFRNSHGENFGVEGWCFATESVATHGGGSTVLTAA